MADIRGLGSFGIMPYMSEDMLKQVKYADIKSKAGKIAYGMTQGDKTKKPQIQDGIDEARGALKWIAEVINKEEDQ